MDVCVRINITQNVELFEFIWPTDQPPWKNTWLHKTQNSSEPAEIKIHD